MFVTRLAHRAVSVGLAFGLAIPLVACSERTGILVEVSRDEATTPAEIDQLRFFVGLATDNASGYLDDGDPAQQVDMPGGRDLAADPYRLLINRADADTGAVKIAVTAYQNGQLVGFGGLDQMIPFLDGKVVQWDVMVKGDWIGRVDETETGCLAWTTDDGTVIIASPDDHDCDGDPGDVDCNDEDPTVGPSQPEICNNDINDDCDAETDEEEDVDGDGVYNCEDCDDNNKFRFPGNTEVCDGIDNDCNQRCDDGPLDFDGDDYTICDRKILSDGSCSDVNPAHNDCNDHDPEVHPGAVETCNGVDDNCNEQCDEGFDQDHDTFTACGSRIDVCDGTKDTDVDCAPENENAFPGNVPEWCDGVDNDCNGVFYPATVPCYVSSESQCVIGTRSCGDAEGEGWTSECKPPLEEPQVVPGSLCAAYDGECAETADPYGCANDVATVTTYSCTLNYHEANPEQLCQPASALLPNSVADALCHWGILPAFGRPPAYDIGFSEVYNGTSLSDAIALCQPFVVINGPLVVPPVHDRYLLFQHVETQTNAVQMFQLDITPVAVSECAGNGLICPDLPDF